MYFNQPHLEKFNDYELFTNTHRMFYLTCMRDVTVHFKLLSVETCDKELLPDLADINKSSLN